MSVLLVFSSLRVLGISNSRKTKNFATQTKIMVMSKLLFGFV